MNTCASVDSLFTTSNGYADYCQSPLLAMLFISCTGIFSMPSVYYDNVVTWYKQSPARFISSHSKVLKRRSVYWISSLTCFTQTIYQISPDIGPMINSFCANDWCVYILYRDIPSTTTPDSGTSGFRDGNHYGDGDIHNHSVHHRHGPASKQQSMDSRCCYWHCGFDCAYWNLYLVLPGATESRISSTGG